MVGFRFVALGYALLVFMIAPAWLAAEEEPDSPAPIATVEDSATAVQEAVPEVPDVPVETPVIASDEADDPDPDPATERKDKADREPKDASSKAGEEKQPAKEPTANASSSASVTISDFKFTPGSVTVNEGDTITWTNDGPSVHTATSKDGSFDTGALRKGESGSATFTQAGTISYICQPHPFMHGTIVVQAATSTGSGSGSGSSGGTGTGSTDDTGSGGESSAGSGTSGLPHTGGEALAIALLGLATLGFGLLLRSRRAES